MITNKFTLLLAFAAAGWKVEIHNCHFASVSKDTYRYSIWPDDILSHHGFMSPSVTMKSVVEQHNLTLEEELA
jgi:hypothetical protein